MNALSASNPINKLKGFPDSLELRHMETGEVRMKVNNSDEVLPKLMKFLSENGISPESMFDLQAVRYQECDYE